MDEDFITGHNARWSVLWVVRRNGRPPRIVEFPFENDLRGALELYVKAKGKKPFATLRCANVGFPPPEKYRPYERAVVKRVKRDGRTIKIKDYTTVEPMGTLNLRGMWWCPYCREFRKFQHQDGFHFHGQPIYVEGVHCPICGISHRDHHVRKWNPQAQTIPFKLGARRASSRSRSRTRRTRRRT